MTRYLLDLSTIALATELSRPVFELSNRVRPINILSSVVVFIWYEMARSTSGMGTQTVRNHRSFINQGQFSNLRLMVSSQNRRLV